MNKPKLLLHACCATCSGFLAQELSKTYDITIYFDNSNIFPEEEYVKRKEEAKKFFDSVGFEFICADYDHDKWLRLVNGLEAEPERGSRCSVCYKYRLEKSASFAKDNGFDFFASTLAISPHKNSLEINRIGQALSKDFEVAFLEGDWKKNEGFKNAMIFSRSNDFYRQSYCGCEFSVRKES